MKIISCHIENFGKLHDCTLHFADGLNTFCEENGLKVERWIEETISGNKAYDKRELGRLLGDIDKDDIIICAELSRLGRNLFMIMEILNICMTKECKVWTIKDNYRLGDDIQSKVLNFPSLMTVHTL